MSRVLIVEDDPGVLSLIGSLLKGEGYDIRPVTTGEKALETLASETFDLMISDIRLGTTDGMQLLKHAQEHHPRMAVIMITGFGSVETAVQAMKEGAFDYITKPFKVDDLLLTVSRALNYQVAVRENAELRAQLEGRSRFENIVAVSPAMRRVCEMIERVSGSDMTVLIQGESGTGKELVAQAIHAHSNRRNRRFIAINCAALPEPLLESELFGHVKGSFTGATSDKEGLFLAAGEGTIMLDEIGSMPIALQGKLLRVLEQREVRRVGDTETFPMRARVLAATNEQLEKQIEKEKFRRDLYYRLNVITIEIPPLRTRRDDILPMVHFAMRKELGAGAALPSIEAEAQLILENYDWPGNVRELENAIRYACTFIQNGKITRDVLPARIVHAVDVKSAGGQVESAGGVFHGQSLKHYLRDQEKRFLRDVIASMGGDKRRAAEALKVSLATLYRKLPDDLQ